MTKTNLTVRPDIIALRFDEKSFYSAILSFNPHWDNKHYNEYFSQKFINIISTKDKFI